jgi:hypothetical protein
MDKQQEIRQTRVLGFTLIISVVLINLLSGIHRPFAHILSLILTGVLIVIGVGIIMAPFPARPLTVRGIALVTLGLIIVGHHCGHHCGHRQSNFVSFAFLIP